MHCSLATKTLSLIAGLIVCLGTVISAHAEILLQSLIDRVKGQEENVLQGQGIVTGLSGTGDGASFAPTAEALASIMTILGGQPTTGKIDPKNVAMVSVQVVIPGHGARQGDRVTCRVTSIGAAKSLRGGTLFLTPLIGPDRTNPQIYAFASGEITLDDSLTPTSGVVYRGCRLEQDIRNPFMEDGKITLVIKNSFASWQVADNIAETINNPEKAPQFGVTGQTLARAIDQNNVEVIVPEQYRNNPVQFIALVQDCPLITASAGPRVVINERAESIVISGDVEIGPVLVTHKSVTVQAGQGLQYGRFVAVDQNSPKAPNQKLEHLLQALEAINVPTRDIIEIIKGIEADGKLYAELVFR